MLNNSIKRVRALHIDLEFGSVGFVRRGENRSIWEKPLGAKESTNNKTQPSYGVNAAGN